MLVDPDEVEPSKFVTVNDLMPNGKKHLLFLDKDEKILNLYSALVKRIDFVRSKGSYILGRMPYVNGEDNLLRKIEKFFNVKPRMERGGRYRIDSKPLAEFFRNFFVYRPAWESLTIEQIKNLKNQWDCLGV